MNAHTPQTMVQRVAQRWADYRSSRAALAEFNSLPRSLIEEIAREANIDPQSLHDFVAAGPEAGRLMDRMLDALGIDREEFERSMPLVLRDAAVTCARCGDKGRCRQELAAGTAAAHAAEFCPNQPTFASLV